MAQVQGKIRGVHAKINKLNTKIQEKEAEIRTKEEGIRVVHSHMNELEYVFDNSSNTKEIK